MASLGIPIPKSTLALGHPIKMKLSTGTVSYPATRYDVDDHDEDIYRNLINAHKKFLQNIAITKVSAFWAEMTKITKMKNTHLNGYILSFLDIDEINRFKTILISFITNGTYIRHLNISKGLAREIIVSHIKNNTKIPKEVIKAIRNIHPLHLHDLFKSRANFMEILPISDDVLHTALRASVSLSDFIYKFFLLELSGKISQKTITTMDMFYLWYLMQPPKITKMSPDFVKKDNTKSDSKFVITPRTVKRNKTHARPQKSHWKKGKR